MIEPSVFSAIELDTRDKTPASPSPDRGWHGLVLRAPTKITVPTNEAGHLLAPLVIPVCGFHRLEISPVPSNEVEQLVIRPQGQTQEYRGPFVSTDPSPVIPPPLMPAFSPAQLAGIIVDTHFNADLAALVDFPLETGVYDLWFEFRDKRSNTESLELVLMPADPSPQ